jgi:hypothetical protein
MLKAFNAGLRQEISLEILEGSLTFFVQFPAELQPLEIVAPRFGKSAGDFRTGQSPRLRPRTCQGLFHRAIIHDQQADVDTR